MNAIRRALSRVFAYYLGPLGIAIAVIIFCLVVVLSLFKVYSIRKTRKQSNQEANDC